MKFIGSYHFRQTVAILKLSAPAAREMNTDSIAGKKRRVYVPAAMTFALTVYCCTPSKGTKYATRIEA